MTEEQKKMVVDMMMHINQAILKDNTTEVVVVKEEFVAPKDDKSTETDNTPKATSTPRGKLPKPWQVMLSPNCAYKFTLLCSCSDID